VSEWPSNKAAEFPPVYTSEIVPRYEKPANSVPVISVGRLGTLTLNNRPADDAFIAMIDASKEIIRMSLQDLGPVCIPSTKLALPGLKWPKVTLNALARAIWVRGVDVEIVVSNPGSIPGGLGMTEACYGNGWTCVDVASEIIKRIKKQFPGADDAALRKKVEQNLRVCFIRHAKKNTYADGKTIGNHSKFFIIDDMAAYVGSQNLYMCDLAEWGVIVDDASETQKMIKDFWTPLWDASFTGEDCDVQDVMDGLHIDRDGEEVNILTAAGRQQAESAAAQSSNSGLNKNTADLYGTEVAVA
jgi:phosphatidylserine/phosphatidylglycerophosphate/cardiolipin synthase-like enzyme